MPHCTPHLDMVLPPAAPLSAGDEVARWCRDTGSRGAGVRSPAPAPAPAPHSEWADMNWWIFKYYVSQIQSLYNTEYPAASLVGRGGGHAVPTRDNRHFILLCKLPPSGEEDCEEDEEEDDEDDCQEDSGDNADTFTKLNVSCADHLR